MATDLNQDLPTELWVLLMLLPPAVSELGQCLWIKIVSPLHIPKGLRDGEFGALDVELESRQTRGQNFI